MNAQSVLPRILVFAALALFGGVRSFAQAPIDNAATPPISQAGSSQHDRLLEFVSVPSKALPGGVRLVERVDTAPLVPLTRNPAVLVDQEMIKRVAVFFGIREKADLQPVRAGVVAIYQENDPASEIGVYGLWFSDRKAAKEWSKRLKADSEGSPFLLKDDLLLRVWKDDSVSDEAFTTIRDYFKSAKLERGRPR